jgi:hypothetical protein
MDIKYKNSYGDFIMLNKALQIDEYRKAYYDNNQLLKEELFYQGNIVGLHYINFKNEDHQVIVRNAIEEYGGVVIIEYQMFGLYKLEKSFSYNKNGYIGNDLALFGPQGDVIAHGFKDENDKYEYDRTRKYYYNRAINPERELFECTYDPNTGALLEIYWNNSHVDSDGQESFSLLNTPADHLELIDLTGMSIDLVNYYMSSEIVPNF